MSGRQLRPACSCEGIQDQSLLGSAVCPYLSKVIFAGSSFEACLASGSVQPVGFLSQPTGSCD